MAPPTGKRDGVGLVFLSLKGRKKFVLPEDA